MRQGSCEHCSRSYLRACWHCAILVAEHVASWNLDCPEMQVREMHISVSAPSGCPLSQLMYGTAEPLTVMSTLMSSPRFCRPTQVSALSAQSHIQSAAAALRLTDSCDSWDSQNDAAAAQAKVLLDMKWQVLSTEDRCQPDAHDRPVLEVQRERLTTRLGACQPLKHVVADERLYQPSGHTIGNASAPAQVLSTGQGLSRPSG